MKKSLLFILSVLFIIVFLVTCKKDNDKVTGDVKVMSVKLNKESLTLGVGETETLIATVLPENATIKEVYWTSSNPTVATVTNGLVTPISVGTAKIIVTTLEGNKTATCELEVYKIEEPVMVFVEGGTFIMGCIEGECESNELPTHQVTVSSFYMGKYEITQKEWEGVMGNNPSSIKGDNLPVENVSWNDIQEFIFRLNAVTGKKYRLPTEAEWEYAARGGNQSNGFKYSGSNNLDAVAWYAGNSGNNTHPVGYKQPNELGIYDMSGNVWEWCSDWYGEYPEFSQINPQGPVSGSERIGRGGAYYVIATRCRVSNRDSDPPNLFGSTLGFRLVLSL